MANNVKLFTAKWCSNCRFVKKEAEQLGWEIIDIEEQPSVAKEYRVRSLPTAVVDIGQGGQNVFVGEKQILHFIKYTT